MELSDRAKETGEVRVIISVAKIPACRGTKPHVTKTTLILAQNTAQCLYKISMPNLGLAGDMNDLLASESGPRNKRQKIERIAHE